MPEYRRNVGAGKNTEWQTGVMGELAGSPLAVGTVLRVGHA